jgi:hypothetical protein
MNKINQRLISIIFIIIIIAIPVIVIFWITNEIKAHNLEVLEGRGNCFELNLNPESKLNCTEAFDNLKYF